MENNNIQEQKIAVIGAGVVGATTAYTLMVKGLAAEIILIDINKDKQEGEVLDINDALSFSLVGCVKGGEHKDARDADIIILTAGVAQKPGETRLDLVKKNKAIVSSIFKEIGTIKQTAIIIVVSNPVDIITHLSQELSGLPKNQVFGTGTCLDSARLRSNVAKKFKVDPAQVDGFVFAEHGNSEFVAWSTVSVAGKKALDLLSNEEMYQIENEVKNEVYEIIKRKGATYYGIAMVAADIVNTIFLDENKVLPVSSLLYNCNGVSGVCLGAPMVVGRGGIIRTWPITLSEEEKNKLQKSADTIREYLL